MDSMKPFWKKLCRLMTDGLRSFLELNLPKVKEGKKPKFSLGVSIPKLGSHIFEVTKIPCQSNEFVFEILRGARLHFEIFIKDLKPGDIEKAQLGLGHSYSWAKVKFNVNWVDNMVIQAIFLLDTLDKDSMREGKAAISRRMLLVSCKELQQLRVESCKHIKEYEVSPALSTLFSVLKELKWRPDAKSLLGSSLAGTGMGRKGGKFFKKSQALKLLSSDDIENYSTPRISHTKY